MEGKIIKGIGGFYYVHDGRSRVYACRAVGIFRNRGEKPLVGDRVTFEITDEKDREGSVTAILPRKNDLIRPAAANIDQAMLIFSLARPAPNWNLLDRFLVMIHKWNVPVVLILNKSDLVSKEDVEESLAIYRGSGCRILCISAIDPAGEDTDRIRHLLHGKTTILAGPSGVGKSTLLNHVCPDAGMQTGEISRKIKRGRHTTRHSELFFVEEDSFLMDTPGFTSLDVFAEDIAELAESYPEFSNAKENCRFLNCAHIGEKECGVKEAAARGEISRVRYENYCQLAGEIRNRKKY